MQKLILKDPPEQTYRKKWDQKKGSLYSEHIEVTLFIVKVNTMFYTGRCTGDKSFASAKTQAGSICGTGCFLKIVIQIP